MEQKRTAIQNGNAAVLRSRLHAIDHRGYPAYKELAGQYDFGRYMLSIDHVQGDPFASPSSLSIHSKGTAAGFPEMMWQSYENRRALQDHLIRLFAAEIDRYSHKTGGSGKSGLISCAHPGQEILDRTACQIDGRTGDVVLRFYVGFPAAGRTILAGNLEKILFDFLPVCAEHTLFYGRLDQKRLQRVIDLAEDQTFLRKKMEEQGLAAFVADGSILPRESGVSQKPMQGAVPFVSPDRDALEVVLPHRGRVRGMGIRRGITLIIGGGYHGKSTLLQALERGVYDHIEGDGRELVLTDATAVKVRAEDGRAVSNDDIYPFIRNLPDGRDTHAFSTQDASGSTSQAAAVTEALESGAKVLLMDEDTSAANFMVRDDLMQQIVSQEEEPIVPYSRNMRGLWLHQGVSTILVAGSSGAFFASADMVLQMDHYVPKDVTEKVRAAVPFAGGEAADAAAYQWDFSVRKPHAVGDAFKGREHKGTFSKDSGETCDAMREKAPSRISRVRAAEERSTGYKIKSLGRDGFMIGHQTTDLRAVEQIVDGEQTECLAKMLVFLAGQMDGRDSLQEWIRRLEAAWKTKGFSAFVTGKIPGNLCLPRMQELYAAADRCRGIRMNG